MRVFFSVFRVLFLVCMDIINTALFLAALATKGHKDKTRNTVGNALSNMAEGVVAAIPNVSVEGMKETVDRAITTTIKGAVEMTGTPATPESIMFVLRSSKNRDLMGNAASFDLNRIACTEGKVFFIIHGWLGNGSVSWYEPMTEALLERYHSSHVVQVDWGTFAQKVYALAAFCTESIGSILAHIAHKLVNHYNFPVKKIVFIGFSLGGQITGFIGKEYKKLTNERLSWIIALDPAGPIFNLRPDSRRLNKNDAKVVLVLHTDRLKLGFPNDCGTIDFYPNGGYDQPGCIHINLTDLSLLTLAEPIICSHMRAPKLFIQAIQQPNAFVSIKCENITGSHQNCDKHVKASLGHWQTKKTGSFYFETTEEAPFLQVGEYFNNIINIFSRKNEEEEKLD